jgi:hypothetical protein
MVTDHAVFRASPVDVMYQGQHALLPLPVAYAFFVTADPWVRKIMAAKIAQNNSPLHTAADPRSLVSLLDSLSESCRVTIPGGGCVTRALSKTKIYEALPAHPTFAFDNE